MKITNSRGVRCDPCGIPDLGKNTDDLQLLYVKDIMTSANSVRF